MSLRFTLTEWVAGEDAPSSRPRQLIETFASLLALLAVALLFPTASEKIFAVTGATAVCLVVYVVPVVIHLLLRYQQPVDGGQSAGTERMPLLETGADAGGQPAASKQRHCGAEVQGWLGDVAVPCAVLVVGVGFSLAALWVAVSQMLTQ